MAENTAESANSGKKLAVVGGGLVGALEAIFMAKRGYQVELYEYRKDPRGEEIVRGRSINLALSVRGITSLKAVGAEKEVIEGGIPMHARMIHSHSGKRTPIPYGKEGQYIMSVERRKLNEHLLSVAETYPNVKLNFEHKLVSADLYKGSATFKRGDQSLVDVNSDLIIGTDGAYSSVRREMMRMPRFDFQQHYIPHGYKELCMLPIDGKHGMEVNYLHIWPRQTFMMIALPNQDKTFTCTMFMPFETFDSLQTREDVLSFFEREFPDVIPLFGVEYLLDQYFQNPVGAMVCVKCKPYHVKDKSVILGDAAHAIVPFYGQGMNSGFEDCIVLDELFDKHQDDIGAALAEYSIVRNPDAEAICDLALYNYIEMRSLVTSRAFLFHKKLMNFLHWLMPNSFIPLYTMVTFSRKRYSETIKQWKWQDKLIYKSFWTCMYMSALASAAFVAYRKLRKT